MHEYLIRSGEMPRLRNALVLTLVALAGAASASEQAALEPYVVTATRQPVDPLLVPTAVDVISARELHRAQPAIHLSESLYRIPGVVARDRWNYAQDLQISIRGFGARSAFGVRGVQLFTDGIPATMPDGQGQVSHFMLESASRIEVLRGPFSALYGNASGGVIEVFTMDAPAVPSLRAGYVAGDDGLGRAALSFHTPWQDGSFLFDVTDVDFDGFRDHSAAARRNAQALLKGDLGEHTRYTLLGNWLDLDALDPQGLTREQWHDDPRQASANALLFDTRKTVEQQQLGARIEHELSAAQALEFTAYSGDRRTRQVLGVPVFVQQQNVLHGGGAIDLDRDYYGMDARWRWTTQWLAHAFSLIAGMEYEVADERRRGFENFRGEVTGVFGALRRDEDNRVRNHDIYVQAGIELAPRWHAHVGARYSRVRFTSDDHFIDAVNPDDSGTREFSRTSPVAGLLFRLSDATSLYANAGAGFETPTFAELAYRDDGASGLNTALAPAVSRNVELGLRARRAGMEHSFAVFESRTEDELVVAANEGGRSVYANAGRTRRRGVEYSAAVPLGETLHFALAATWLDAKYLEGFGPGERHIPGLARRSAWAEIEWTPARDLAFALEGRYVDRIYVNDANTEAAPSHARFDLSAERLFEFGGLEWRAFARINNLLDREHVDSVIVNEGSGRYYEPAPGRHWLAGLSATRRFD